MAGTRRAARRGRGEGGISFREDKELWVARISLGFDGGGKRIRKTVYGETKNEVAEKLRKLQADHDAGRLVDAEEITVKEYLTRWLGNTAKETVGDGTWERYRQLVHKYLIPILGGLKLHKVRPLHVEQAYADMKQGNGDRKPAGADARKSAGVVLSIALKHAVRNGLIPANPAAEVKKARPARREMAFMTPGQAKRFLVAAERNQNFALFSLALGSGARQGELLGLVWSDFDFDRGTMSISRALSQVKGEFKLKEPKSQAGRRTVTLAPSVLAALREHRAAALKGGRIAAPVFCTRTGQYLDKKNVLRAFKTIVKNSNGAEEERAGESNSEPDLIPARLRFHDLRHTHASGLIAAGGSIKAVSRRLGHADVSITLRVYAHLMPDDDEKLATLAGTLFG
ncbi:tyrosine-type recombinase/integrase [Gemmata sp.]|uniref:tyrosine-type recombinase/integrase n=1 Tax=Gemmata sp. TaxID=1914242 RepID=UPI003F6F4B01